MATRSNHGDQATVAPSHSTVSRLDESSDSCEMKAAKKRQHMSRHHQEDCYDFDEELLSFAQLNTSEPSAVYLTHADGMEVILKNGVISDATVYSWSPSPGELAKVKEVQESMLPVEEISFFPEDSHYSTLIDQDQGDDSRFASLNLDFKSTGAEGVMGPSTVEDYLDAQFGSSFLSTLNTSSSTEHSKPTAAMLKRMSVFTGEDLLTQEADTFAKQFLEQDEKSKSSMAKKQSNPHLRSSESRLLAAFKADDDTISKDRSIVLLNNFIDGHDDEDATISTVTGINIYPTRTETIAESALEVTTNRFCGLFFSEPIITEADDGDDYSDIYSRPSTTESFSFYHTYR